MSTHRRRAVAALTTAGLAWGTTVPLTKLALQWLAPGWLTFARFGVAAAVLLLVASRPGVRAASTPSVLASGAIGYGGSVVLQNAGVARTSVTHAALLIGAVPVLVAIIAALWHQTVARPVAWAGFVLSLAGVGLTAAGRGGGATIGGDALVLASLLLSATFTVAQGRLLRGRDPVAVTAVQFLGAALAALPFSVIAEGIPAVPSPGTVLATAGLAAGGTLLPFTLFAYGQSRISAEVAGAFLNLEPLVGAVAGAVIFGDPAGPGQLAGGAAIIAGIAMSSLPLFGDGRRRPWPSRRGAGGAAAPLGAGRGKRAPAAAVQAEPAPSTAGGHPRVTGDHRHAAGRGPHPAGCGPGRQRSGTRAPRPALAGRPHRPSGTPQTPCLATLAPAARPAAGKGRCDAPARGPGTTRPRPLSSGRAVSADSHARSPGAP